MQLNFHQLKPDCQGFFFTKIQFFPFVSTNLVIISCISPFEFTG